MKLLRTPFHVPNEAYIKIELQEHNINSYTYDGPSPRYN
jgi:hypothetical protein